MVGPLNRKPNASGSSSSGATRRSAIGLILGAPLLGACASVQQSISQFSNPFGGSEGPAGPQQEPTAVGSGQVKIGLILPLSAAGNAGVAALSMKNAAEMALAEFQNPNIQLLIKDDAGSPQGANAGAQQAVNEGAEIILGPLFAASVPAVAQVARTRGISVVAFSTDSSVAGRGVYLLSFLPESDVNRIVDYAAGTGKRSFAALVPDNAYGNVVEASFKQAVGRKGRLVVFEKYSGDRSTPARAVAQQSHQIGDQQDCQGVQSDDPGAQAATHRRQDAGGQAVPRPRGKQNQRAEFDPLARPHAAMAAGRSSRHLWTADTARR